MRPQVLLSLALCLSLYADEIPLSAVFNARDADFEHARPTAGQTPTNQPLVVNARPLRGGVGAEVNCRIAVALAGATHFTALAGVDDTSPAAATIRFAVQVDGQTVWQRDVKRGEPAADVDLDLAGKSQLVLVTTDIGNTESRALADWGEARFTYAGVRPSSNLPPAIVETREILTPETPAAPRLNGARVFGVRPGHPFLFTIPATGDRPMKFAAENLPEGLKLDTATGRITGTVNDAGTHVVTLRATNGRGMAESSLRIEVGNRIALTPPMGWNSWNCWGVSVDADKVLASARAMASSGLIQHGWTYVNIDDTWQGNRAGPSHALQPNEKFPDAAKLADAVHALGLKIGIYSTPWVTSYAHFPGGSADNPTGAWQPPAANDRRWRHIGSHSFAAVDAQQWAAWGFDYLKYDWNPNQPPETREMADALNASGRDIVYSLSNSAPFANAAVLSQLANCWRTTGDIHDSWGSIRGIWAQQDKWRPFAGPAHWNDPDMLVVGDVDVGSGKNLHPSRLTPNEQYSHISLWCLLSAPLLIGCPIERLDAFTLGLLTNDEVLALDQDELGAPAAPVLVEGRKIIYVKPLADESVAVGLFNLAEDPQEVTASWTSLRLEKPARLRDLWRQQDLSVNGDSVSAMVPRHGVVLLRVWPRT